MTWTTTQDRRGGRPPAPSSKSLSLLGTPAWPYAASSSRARAATASRVLVLSDGEVWPLRRRSVGGRRRPQKALPDTDQRNRASMSSTRAPRPRVSTL